MTSRTGEQPAFDDWYAVEYPRVVNTVAAAFGNRDLAADAAAEAFTRAYERWARVGRMDRPGAWVQRVAFNVARRRLRRRGVERDLVSAGPAPEPAWLPERDHDLWAAVARLPERTRAAVVLRYVADLTEPEVARVLGVRRGTVATMLRRARTRLADDVAVITAAGFDATPTSPPVSRATETPEMHHAVLP